MTIDGTPSRLAEHGDPWADIDEHPQSIGPVVDRFDADRDAGVPDAPWPPVYPKMPDETAGRPSRARQRD